MAFAQDASLDRSRMSAPVVDHDAAIGVKDQVVIDVAKRKIAVELDPVIVRSRAWRQDLDDNNRVWDLQGVEVGGSRADDEGRGLEGGAGCDRTVIPSGNIRQGNPARLIPFSNAF